MADSDTGTGPGSTTCAKLVLFRVYYWRSTKAVEKEVLRILLEGKTTTKDIANKDMFVMVYEEKMDSKQVGFESLFSKFNGGNNPLATAAMQKKIKEWQTHTSMSVGDVIELDSRKYAVSPLGFTEI